MARNEFLHITGQKYDSMRTRFAAKYDGDNHLMRAGRAIPFTKDEFRVWIRACQEAGLRCAYCERALKLEEIEADHIVPVKKRSGPLALSNLCVACHDCNVRKGDLTGEEWRALRAGLQTFPEFARKYIFAKLAYRPIFRPDDRAKPSRKASQMRISPVSAHRAPVKTLPFEEPF